MFFLVLFCLIQGFSEFLPVSSQGHLIVFNSFFNLDDFAQLSILELNIISHFGSLLAVTLYYNKLLIKMFKGLRVFYRPDLDKNLNLLFKLLISSIPIVIVGFFFAKTFDYNAQNIILIIGITSILGSLVLYFLDNYCLLIRNQDTFSFSLAFLTGIIQCFSLVPGMSRAGANMIVLRAFGFNRNFTIRYSNLLSIPVISGATVFLFLNDNNIYFDGILNLSAVLVFFFSFLFSIIFIHLLVSWVRRSSLLIFIIYRMIFGISLIIFFFYF